MKALLVATILIGTFGCLTAQDTDPFDGDVASEPERVPTTLKFKSGTELEVNDDRLAEIDLKEIHFDLDLSSLAKRESAGIEDRRAVRFFDRPKAMWRLDDGFLAAYDGGEFGGALFYFSRDGKTRELVVAEHISDLISVSKRQYVATGGLEHLDSATGVVVSLKQGQDLRWKSQVVARFFDGIAGISGRTKEGTTIVSTWRSIASGHLTPPDGKEAETRVIVGAHFELKNDGWMRYLGESVRALEVNRPMKKQNSEQAGAGQPATAPESKPAGGGNTKPESGPAPR